MGLTLVLVSLVGYLIIELPPGDFLSYWISRMRIQGTVVGEIQIEQMRKMYGLDLPVHLRYFKWLANLLRGNLGYSVQWNKPVYDLLAERLGITVAISMITLLFTYIVAVPIGIYSATHQYSPGDYAATVFGFIGLATPNFLLALIIMWISFSVFNFNIAGLFSSVYLDAPWSFLKFIDMLKHLPVVIIVVGTAGTAGLIRVMRGTLLDELQKQYVVTARAKGAGERAILFKYPVRVAINPIISTVGYILPGIFSGTVITAIVLNLPTIGPLLFQALQAQDMQLSASIVMVLAALTVFGNLVSDILLVAADPRIRYEKTKKA